MWIVIETALLESHKTFNTKDFVTQMLFQYIEENNNSLHKYESKAVQNGSQIQDIHIKDDNTYFVLSEKSVSNITLKKNFFTICLLGLLT